jgi:integrase
LHRDEATGINIAPDQYTVELPKVKRPRVQPPGEQQARALLEAAKGHRLEAAFWVALMLGLRRGEVLGLLKSNIDFAANTIMIEGSLQRVGTRLVRSTTKTDASQRLLPMPTPLVRVLQKHLQRLEKEREAAGDAWKEQGYLFPSERGTPLEPRNLLRCFKDILKAAGLPDMRFHDLRHWCVALLISYGVHPKAIQDILGHAKITTTLDIYGHLLPTVLRDATEKMAGLVGDHQEDADDDRALQGFITKL